MDILEHIFVYPGPDGEEGEGLPQVNEGDHGRGWTPQDVSWMWTSPGWNASTSNSSGNRFFICFQLLIEFVLELTIYMVQTTNPNIKLRKKT